MSNPKNNHVVRYIVVLLVLFSTSLAAQDLIERSQMGLAAQSTSEPTNINYNLIQKSHFQQISPFSYQEKKKYKSVDGIYSVNLEINPKVQKQLLNKRNWQLDVPVNDNQKFSLKLYPVDVTAPGYKLVDETNHEYRPSQIATYRGIVSDDPSSTATVTVTESHIAIVITDAVSTYNLGPLEDSDHYVLVNDEDYGKMPFECNTAISENISNNLPNEIDIKHTHQKAGDCVKVWFEVDHQSYLNMGSSVSAVESFIRGTFAVVAALYDQYDVPIEISGIKVWTTNDPYGAESNVGTALNYLARNINPATINGDLFHLVSISTRPSGGVAYISGRGGLIKATTIGTSVPFAVSQTGTTYQGYPTYSWSTNVIAHEMGHNMGAPHTHECIWGPNNNTAIDKCYGTVSCSSHNPSSSWDFGKGTIMSYCHLRYNPTTRRYDEINYRTGFGNEVGNHIKSEYSYVRTRNLLSSCSGSNPDPDPDPDPDPVDPYTCSTTLNPTGDWANQFESGVGMIQRKDDDLDWTRKTGSTASPNTGPSGASQGNYYLYVEASSPNYPSKVATIETQCINLSRLTAPTLMLDYHMYGASMGSLEISIITPTDNAVSKVWSVNGNQGTSWRSNSIDLYQWKNQTIIIQLKATTGNGWQSDICIDNLRIEQAEIITCNDNIQNGDETGVDCGGSSCAPCEECEFTNLVINSNRSYAGNQKEVARNTITANSNVTVFGKLLLQGANGVSINSTMDVKPGAELTISASGCNN